MTKPAFQNYNPYRAEYCISYGMDNFVSGWLGCKCEGREKDHVHSMHNIKKYATVKHVKLIHAHINIVQQINLCHAITAV